MGIQTQLLGIGNNDEIVTVIGQIDISEDGKMALLTFENKSPLPLSGTEPKLISLTFNIGSLNEGEARVLNIEPATWKLVTETKESKLQMILQPEQPDLGLALNEKLLVTLLNIEKNGKFKEGDFLGQYGSNNQLQVVASFNSQDSGAPITIEGYFFRAPFLKAPQLPDKANTFQPNVSTTSLAPDVTTTPPPNITTTPPPDVTTTPQPSIDLIEPSTKEQANAYADVLSILKLTSSAMRNSFLKCHPNDPGFTFKLSLFGLANLEVSTNFSLNFPTINKLCAELIKGARKV